MKTPASRARLVCLAALLPAALRAAPPPAGRFGESELDRLDTEVRGLEKRLEQDDVRLKAMEDGYGRDASLPPGGPERDRLVAEMRSLTAQVAQKRHEFHDIQTGENVARALMVAAAVRGRERGRVDDDMRQFQERAEFVTNAGSFVERQNALLADEEDAHRKAMVPYEAARARRRAAEEAAALLSALGLAAALLLRRRASPAPALPPPAPADGPGTFLLSGPEQPWAFGRRFSAVPDGGGRALWLHVLDERFHPRPPDAARLASALASACALRHPSLPEYVSAAADVDGVKLMTAAAPGEPLARWTEEGRPMPLGAALPAFLAAADALDAAHRSGLYHGALTPESILAGPGGTGALLDLGVAMACAAVSPARCGLPAYAAPESETGRPDARADVYALGLMLYEALTGRPAFDGTNLAALKRERRYFPATRLVPGLPAGVDGLLSRMLDPDPAGRRPAPGGLRAALEAGLGRGG